VKKKAPGRRPGRALLDVGRFQHARMQRPNDASNLKKGAPDFRPKAENRRSLGQRARTGNATQERLAEGQLHRIVVKGQSLYCQTADTLLAYFGYELVKKKSRTKK